jgi:hypothetical protein
MPRKTRDIVTGLKRKGFVDQDGDHKFYVFVVDGKITQVYTKISHGEKEITDSLLGYMARQLHLPRADFDDLVDCPLTQEDYIQRMRDAGHIQ